MLPKVVLHSAVSVDGRMDWIAPDLGVFYGLVSRWNEDATLVGSETILSSPEGAPEDDREPFEPAKTDVAGTRPLLVVPDSRGRVHSWNSLRRTSYWRDAVALCSRSTPAGYLDYLKRKRVDCIVAGDDRVDLRSALEELNGRYGVKVVRVDSGGTLCGALLRAGLVDEVSVVVSPCLVGGTTPRSLFIAPNLASSDGVIQVRLAHLERLEGDTVWLLYEVAR